jgi:aminopeptidase N
VKREETRQRTRTVWETTAPLPDLTLVAGPYRIKQRQAGPATVYTFFGSDHAALADSYLATAVADLKLYRDLFGPYPYPKFAVVENFFPTGYGFPSWTLLGSTIVPLPFIVTTSLGHEIAHNWWGTGVRVDYRHGNWSEGLATYVADYLFKEQTSQEAAREYRLKLLRDYATLVPPGGGYPLADFTSRRSKLDQAIGYGKSAMVFHMARRRVGEDNFWGGLRRLAAEKMFQTATWTDFARAFDPDGSFGMNGFFRQWVERAGAPVLKLDTVRSKETNGRWQVSGRLLQQGPVYRLDLPIKIEFQEGPPDRDVLPVGAAATEFRLEVPRRPRRLSVDPDAEVFRRLDPGELPVTVNSLRSATDLWVVLTADLPDGTRKAVQDLLTGLRRSAVWVEAKDLSAHDLSGHDLLFVGWPRDPEKQPTLPASLAIDENGFTLAGQLFRGDEDVLFTTLPQPRDGQRTVAILLSSSARATAVAARKIPHYGKYSYLVFRAGSNRVKGTWPPAESPLSHDFAHTTGK